MEPHDAPRGRCCFCDRRLRQRCVVLGLPAVACFHASHEDCPCFEVPKLLEWLVDALNFDGVVVTYRRPHQLFAAWLRWLTYHLGETP